MTRRAPFAVYPIAVMLLVGLHLLAASGVSPFAAVRGLLIVLLLGIAASAAGTALVRDRDRGGLLGLLFVFVLVAGGRPGVAPILLFPIALLVVERYGPRQLKMNWAWIGRLLSRGTAIFALAVLLEAIQFGRFSDFVTALQREGPFRSMTAASAPAGAPDVYVLLLDGYARADIMRDRYRLDDSPFRYGLTSRGFQLATENHSNYLITNLSLSSFLNYRELQDVPAIKPVIANPSSNSGPAVYRAISTAAVLDEFRSVGYETITVASGFEQVAVRGADDFIDPGQINEFEIQLLRPSLVAPLATTVAPDVFSGQQRDRIESIFTTVEGLAGSRSDRPRFVFAHVPSPHAPWVDRSDGSPRIATNLETYYWDTPETTGLSRDEIVESYSGQAAYVGRRTLAAIDAIIAGSQRPPVILVLSDHGSSLDVTASNAETRLRNLFAAYTPGRSDVYANDVTLVNVFPTLFDAYFGRELPRAPETIFTQGPRGLFDPVPIAP